MFPHSLGIMSSHQSAKSLLVLWVEAQEHTYLAVVEEEEIMEDEIVLDRNMPGSKVGDYSGPQKKNQVSLDSLGMRTPRSLPSYCIRSFPTQYSSLICGQILKSFIVPGETRRWEGTSNNLDE